jgi:hypothetical protein
MLFWLTVGCCAKTAKALSASCFKSLDVAFPHTLLSRIVKFAPTLFCHTVILQKASPNFEREYNLKYLGKIGNVFHTKDIEAAIEKGRKYDPDAFNPYYFTSKSMGIDPAWGSSAFGIK